MRFKLGIADSWVDFAILEIKILANNFHVFDVLEIRIAWFWLWLGIPN